MESDSFVPKNLSSAVNSLASLLLGIDFSDFGPSRLQRIRDKLLKHNSLQADDLFVLFRFFEDLNSLEQSLFENQVHVALESRIEGIETLAFESFRLFGPIGAMDIAIQSGLFGANSNVPASFSESSNVKFSELLSTFAQKGRLFEELEKALLLSVSKDGVLQALKLFYKDSVALATLERGLPRLVSLLLALKCSKEAVLEQLEIVAELIVAADISWNTKMLSETTMVGFLVSWLLKANLKVTADFPHLFNIFNEYERLNNALRDLDEKVPERGRYWKTNLHRAQKVIPKRFGKLVGVAMFYKSHVIVEFGPVGNSAFIYKREVFENQIENSVDWKVSNLVDSTIKLLSSAEPGKIYHVPDRWMSQTDELLRALLRE